MGAFVKMLENHNNTMQYSESFLSNYMQTFSFLNFFFTVLDLE